LRTGLRVFACWWAAALIACGGGKSLPVAPTVVTSTPDPGFPAGTVISIVSGETGLPVAGASLYIGGRPTAADAAGRVTLPQRLDPATPIDVTAAGYLDRLTRLRSRDPISLWPRQSPTGLEENFSARIVYTGSTSDQSTFAPSGMIRLADTTRVVAIVPSPDVEADARGLPYLQEGARRVAVAHGGKFAFVVGTNPPAGAVRFDAIRDRSDPTCSDLVLAFVRWRLSGFTIVGGTINFCRVDGLRALGTVTHELGHVFGLRHSISDSDLMYPFNSGPEDFSPREALVMRLMLQRPPSNAYPDTDRHLVSTAGASSAVIACPR
jgi:hypothetical protein